MASFEVPEVTFSLPGPREMVDADRAAQLLTSIDATASRPTHLKLSNKSFSEPAAELIAVALKEICSSSVRVADLSDIIAGKSEEEALQVLRIISNSLAECDLVDLNLSDNALGRPGVLACEPLLRGKSLQKLYVCNDGLSAEASETLAEILLRDGCPPLSVLHFYNNMSGDGGAVAVGSIVRASLQLTDFRFSATRSQRSGCGAVAKSLLDLTHLTSLDLSDGMFVGEASVHLSHAIKGNAGLVSLNLRDAGLGKEGVPLVLEALRGCRELKLLDLSGNDIDAESIAFFCAVLESSLVKLQDLALDDNSIESDGAKLLAECLPALQNLRSLSVCTCEISAAGAYMLAKRASAMPSFQLLKLDGNAIVERGVDEIRALLLGKGKLLGDLEDNDDEGDDDLDDVLEECAGEEEDDLVKALESAKI